MFSTRVKRIALLFFIVWTVSALFFIQFFYNLPVVLENESDFKSVTRNWSDYKSIEVASGRTGLGELGVAADFEKFRNSLYTEYGFDAVLSDYISVNRSVPDARPEGCKSIQYLASLPQASIIVVFYNERLSVLLRTVHSILNRTPDELIRDIILVDDGSDSKELQNPLNTYFNEHFPKDRSKVRLVRLQKRHGLMVSRMTGARAASKDSKVLIFLDAHFEVNYNWLPPLLEPIALNPKTCTVPVIDRIFFKDFHYNVVEPFRGYFDWGLNYAMKSVPKREHKRPTENFPEYVVLGCAIAIGAEFFWQIGGFDEGMIVWGGEQFEISFKVWMCGGQLLGVPCSHMAHLFRDVESKGNTNLYGNYKFTEINYRRLIDVWLDEEHREYVFKHRPILRSTNPGNLTDRIAIRDRLQCKSFTWMMENVMTDLKKVYPPVEPSEYGNGTLQSRADPNSCLEVGKENRVFLGNCKNNKNSVEIATLWHYTWRCEIRNNQKGCLDFDGKNVTMYPCHHTGGNQHWYYNPREQWIVQVNHKLCLVANSRERRVGQAACDPQDMNMKWILTYVNATATKQCKSLND